MSASLLQNLSRRRDLWWQFTVRAVEMRHRGSQLGIVWAVLNPLMMLGLYVTVFGFIFNNRFHAFPEETKFDFALAMFVGLILFHVVSETIGAAPTFIVGNPNLVKKVVFPLEILPLANISALWFHFFISFGLLLIAALISGRTPPLTGLAWAPLILAPHILFSVGLGWLLSALGVFFRDISQMVAFVSQILLYASGVFFSPASIREMPVLWDVLKWNPLLHTVDLARRALLWHQPIDVLTLGYTWAAGLALLLLGGWFFKKTQPAFADVI
jgi:lipopolysaccharide transport system permease protein